MKKILLLIFGLFLLLPLVNAVEIVDFYWTNSQTNTLEINYGESAQFEAYVADGFSDFSVNIFLEEDSTGFITPIINRAYNAGDEAEIIMSITNNYYLVPGSHILHINAINNDQDRISDELFLVIKQQPQQNHAPTIELIEPRNGAQNIPINPILAWEGSDEDNDELTYDVYLNNIIIADDISEMQYQLQNLNYNGLYTWYVEVSDGELSTRSNARNFRIVEQPQNHAPYAPSNPYPSHGSSNIPIELTLTWQGGDPDGDVVTYDVYLNNRLVCDNTIVPSCSLEYPNQLRYNTLYNWHVVASDNELESTGPIWNFRTIQEQENQAPIVDIIAPRENNRINGEYNIRWDAYDNDGSITNTKIYYKGYGIIDELFSWFRVVEWNKYKLLVNLPNNPENYEWDTTQFKNGFYSLKIVVTDDDNAKGEDIVNRFRILNRAEINHAPRINSQPITSVKVNTYYSYDVNAVDADNDHIIYSLTNAPRGMSIDPNTGLIKWLAKDIGNSLITVKATDEHGAFNTQTFIINVLPEEVSIVKVHEFNINNVILNYDNQYINVYVKLDNDGSYNERVQLRAINMNTGDITYDSFLLENGDGYWRILKLPRPSNGVYTIGILGNSKDYKDILYRDIII